MTMPLWISVDAMGGDHGPRVAVPAIIEILKVKRDVHFIICGDKDLIHAEIGNNLEKGLRDRLDIRHSLTVVNDHDKPSSVIRSKVDSSMALAIKAVKEGEADVCISAGNTGALMALSLFLLGVLPGISRPAICTAIPTEKGSCLVLDLGANTDCSANQLAQFALLGSLTAECLYGVKSPMVKLLNIGTESTKGNIVIKQSADLFKSLSIFNYQGFIEGDGLFAGEADVVVCDGFSGNIALKASEGTAKLIGYRFSQFLQQNWRTKLVSLLIGNYLSELKLSLQPEFYNGAFFIGLKGVVIKSHGGTNMLGFKAALNTAIECAQHKLPSRLSSKLEQTTLEQLKPE